MEQAVTTMPMFPLGSVLLPGQLLPLQVFEPRYRQMIEECLETQSYDFGVVLIERGSEVGGADVRSLFGTIATLVQVARLDAVRYAVVAVGRQRIRVREWMDDNPYPRAVVEPWPEEPVPAELEAELSARVADVAQRVRRLAAFAAELGDAAPAPTPDLPPEPLAASYQLCADAPIGPADRQRLLAADGPMQRLILLDAALDDVAAAFEFRLAHDPDSTSEGPNSTET